MKLIDGYGRGIDYLRVSVTDRCNLRCVYCMPALPRAANASAERQIYSAGPAPEREILRFEEILRLCSLFAELGVTRIKVTGGEPLVRRDIVPFIASLKKLAGIRQVTLTTNGVLLAAGDLAGSLADAGIDAVNISLDSIDDALFTSMTGGAGGTGPADILKAAERLIEKNIPVKINCVPIPGLNGEREPIAAMAGLARERKLIVRFIELMPLGAAGAETGRFTPLANDAVRSIIEQKYGALRCDDTVHGNGPAVYYTIDGWAGGLGFISPLSACFCADCKRLRLSSTGLVRPCLAGDLALDLRVPLRSGANDDTLRGMIRTIVLQKPARHRFASLAVPQNQMFSIGG
jgi:cyclic pyranopterin phosphate synthase